jgi:hypothetical protein
MLPDFQIGAHSIVEQEQAFPEGVAEYAVATGVPANVIRNVIRNRR